MVLDLNQDDCKIVKDALEVHIKKLEIDQARAHSPGEKNRLKERIQEIHRVRHKVIEQTK